MAASLSYQTVSVNNAARSAGATYTFPLTVASAAGQERLVALGGISNGSPTTCDYSSVTIDGQTATKVGATTRGYADTGNNTAYVTFWRAPGTSGTSINVVATVATNAYSGYCGLWSLNNAGTLLGSVNYGIGQVNRGTDPVLNVNTATGGTAAAAYLGYGSSPPTVVWVGLTERFDSIIAFTNDVFSGASADIVTGSSPLGIGADITPDPTGSADSNASICVSFNPTAGGTAYTLTAAVGTLTLTGQTATLRNARQLAIANGTLTLTGQTVALRSVRKIVAANGVLTLSGQPVTLSYGRNTKMAAGLGTITMLAPAVGLVYSQSTNKTMPAGIGFARLDGQPVTFKLTYRPIACGLGTLTLAGQPVSLRYGRSTGTSTGTLTLSGQAVAWKRSYGVRAQPGIITLSGDVALTRGRKMTAAQGAMTLTGQAVLLKRGRGLGGATGTITLSGKPVNLNQLIKLHRRMQAVPSTIYLASPWVEMGRSGTEQPGRLTYGQTVVLKKW